MLASRIIPASISAAVVSGWIGAAIAWAIFSGWTDMGPWLTTYGRLDQVVALALGTMCGACILGARARHRRDPIIPALGAGALLGGVSGLIGASLGLQLPVSDSPTAFVIARIVTWALMAGFTAAALSLYSRTLRWICVAESIALGALGGAVAAALFSLPGPAEVWLPIAVTWCGSAIGFASIGPGIWHATLLVHVLPPRETRHSIWSLHERTVDNGWSMPVADAQIACVDGIVYVYPPPSGATLDGYPLFRALPLTRDGLLAVGRSRFRVTVRHHG